MKRTAVITAFAAFALAPVLAWGHCDGDHDDSSASASALPKVATAPALPASKAPSSKAKVATPAPTTVKHVAAKSKTAAPEPKMVATSGN